MDIDADNQILLVDGEDLTEWILENCRGETKYEYVVDYFIPNAKPAEFENAAVTIRFLNPTDAMLFKLRFG